MLKHVSAVRRDMFIAKFIPNAPSSVRSGIKGRHTEFLDAAPTELAIGFYPDAIDAIDRSRLTTL